MKELFSEIPYIEGESIVLRRLTEEDAEPLKELADSPSVNRFLPTFLFEQKYEDPREVILRLYDECFKESIILGVFEQDRFCGLAEMYGYRPAAYKISVGGRLLERAWGRGMAKEALQLMIQYLFEETNIRLITASTMIENERSPQVLRANGFRMLLHAVEEDWGRSEPVKADKWILRKACPEEEPVLSEEFTNFAGA